jgi:hypothetical protein
MGIALEVHLGFAFFVVFAALFVGWVQMGRRVMGAIIGIQILIGVIVAAWAAVVHIPLPGSLWVHVAGALIAMFAYIIGRRIFDRSPNYAIPALALSLLGFIFLILTAAYGISLVFPHR